MHVKDKICTDELELLSISLSPFYLPREFGQVIVTAVYIPPSANTTRASQTIYQCIEKLETASPGAPKIILGDLNTCKLDSVLPTFEQYVSCNTRGEKQLDLCYGNIKLPRLLLQVSPTLNSLQFAYRQNCSVEDAPMTVLHTTYSHLEKLYAYIRIMFVDFSSAFNCMQPHILCAKLQEL